MFKDKFMIFGVMIPVGISSLFSANTYLQDAIAAGMTEDMIRPLGTAGALLCGGASLILCGYLLRRRDTPDTTSTE